MTRAAPPGFQRWLMARAALVPGGSSGSGLAIDRMPRAAGYGLTIAGRSPQRHEGAAAGLPAYGAAKAGLISLTRTLNAEHGDDGVRATAICPGFVDTPMAAWTGMASDEMIQPEDCAEIVRTLLKLSPRARIPQVVIERT